MRSSIAVTRWLAVLAAVAVVAQAAGCAVSPPVPAPRAVASQVPPAIAEQLRKIGPVVAPPATAALYAPAQQREPYHSVKVARDLAYGPHERHRLDVFTPLASFGALARPVLVFVHGGAFVGGNKRTGDNPFYDNIMLWAADNQMVGVNITYRLAPQHPWPAAQEDLAEALRWVRENIRAHGGDPERIVLMGHSAGAAHVAQYLGHERFHVAPGGGVKAAVFLSGLFDTTTAEANDPLKAYFGSDRAQYAARSALPGLLKSRVPMLLAYAELDPPDFRRQALQAQAALCGVGRCPTTLQLMGHSHMSEVYAIGTRDQALGVAVRSFLNGAL